MYLSRKLALLSATLVLCTAALSAQDTAATQSVSGTSTQVGSGQDGTLDGNEQYGRRILVNKFSDNWEIAARIGTQAYLGEYVITSFNFKDWWTLPAMDLSFSKWGTNSVGLSLGFTASPFKSLYMNSERSHATFATDSDPLYSGSLYVARGWMGNAYASFIFDLCNAFGGYRKDRIYSLIASVGGGIMFPMSDVKYKSVSASFNAGLTNKFRLTDHLYLDLAVRGTLHDDNFNGISYYTSGNQDNISVDATIGATVGVSYRFNFVSRNKSKKSKVNEEGWITVDQVVPYTQGYQEVKQEAEARTAELAATTAALAAANDKLGKAGEKVVEVVRDEPQEYRQVVNFVIDTWAISNREKVSVMLAAEFINAHPGQKFLVSGYADKQTATPEHNRMLSEKRADAVRDCLVNEFGVNPDQLQTKACNGVDYMFYNDPQCSRSVIISTL